MSGPMITAWAVCALLGVVDAIEVPLWFYVLPALPAIGLAALGGFARLVDRGRP